MRDTGFVRIRVGLQHNPNLSLSSGFNLSNYEIYTRHGWFRADGEGWGFDDPCVPIFVAREAVDDFIKTIPDCVTDFAGEWKDKELGIISASSFWEWRKLL